MATAGMPPASATAVLPVRGVPQGSLGFPWWNDTVFYEIFVRSFYDSNGDGIGDLQGVIQKLDYLNDGNPETTDDLGVHGIWLMPIFPSPSYHGYDVVDYFDIDPEYGTMADFRQLLSAAHARGIKVIIDLPLNHTSRLHPWFQAAMDPSSPFRHWYNWSQTDPGFRGPWDRDVWHPSPTGYYMGLFDPSMPDLNYEYPDVDAAMKEVARFWLEDVGVDGFRLDAIIHVVEEGRDMTDTEQNRAWLASFHAFCQRIAPMALLVGEAWASTFIVAPYVRGAQVDVAFDFALASALRTSATTGRSGWAISQLVQSEKLYPRGRLAPFLSNHDMTRTMTQLGDSLPRAKAAASLLLTAPGVPFVYYGEELGMLGAKPPDLRVRTPMPWSGAKGGGFSVVTPWTPLSPGHETRNVNAQWQDPGSLLSHYRRLIHLRNRHVALRVGETVRVQSTEPEVYAILRASPAELVLVVVNLGTEPVRDYRLILPAGPLEGRYRAVPLLGEGKSPSLAASARGGFELEPAPALEGGQTAILQLRPW